MQDFSKVEMLLGSIKACMQRGMELCDQVSQLQHATTSIVREDLSSQTVQMQDLPTTKSSTGFSPKRREGPQATIQFTIATQRPPSERELTFLKGLSQELTQVLLLSLEGRLYGALEVGMELHVGVVANSGTFVGTAISVPLSQHSILRPS